MAKRRLEPPAAALNLSVDETATISGLGRTKIYEALKKGDLAGKKVGRRTLIARAEAERFAKALVTEVA